MRATLGLLIMAVTLLLGLGIVLVASAGGVRGYNLYGDSHYFVIRQLVWIVIAVTGCVAAYKFDYHWWIKNQKLTAALYIAVAVALFLVICPGIRCKINGSYRWLNLGSFSVQPGEFAKTVTVIAMSVWLSRTGFRVRSFVKGALLPSIGLGVLVALLLCEPDFGATLTVGLIGGMLMFVAGTRLLHLSIFGISGGVIVGALVWFTSNRMERIEKWFQGIPYQVEQSLKAFQIGGLGGEGFTNSIQKWNYLPEAHTDFIFAIGGEEFGFIFSIGVIIIYMVILACGIFISMRAPDSLGRLLAFGMTFLLTFQAAWNIAVVTGCTITKGLALPFVSYGGTNLITAFIAVGTLLNIGRYIVVCDADGTRVPVVKNALITL